MSFPTHEQSPWSRAVESGIQAVDSGIATDRSSLASAQQTLAIGTSQVAERVQTLRDIADTRDQTIVTNTRTYIWSDIILGACPSTAITTVISRTFQFPNFGSQCMIAGELYLNVPISGSFTGSYKQYVYLNGVDMYGATGDRITTEVASGYTSIAFNARFAAQVGYTPGANFTISVGLKPSASVTIIDTSGGDPTWGWDNAMGFTMWVS